MTTAVAPERHFVTYRRGEIREDILRSWRVHLRKLTNPDTGALFTETEVATATASHSRYWIEADAIDLAMLGHQSNALYLADQVRVDRASTAWLEGFHGTQWNEPRLDAVGGTGFCIQLATTGTIALGSTTIPDPTAYVFTAPDGKRFQNLYTTVATATGAGGAEGFNLQLKAIDTGDETNLTNGTVMTPAGNIPIGIQGDGTVSGNFSGGLDAETDADWASRIADRIKHKPASGNNSHIRTYARRASVAVEDAFVYACALHAGTTVVTITQKRGTALGPFARIPSSTTLATVTAYLVPPGSPVLPHPPFIIVNVPEDLPSDAIVKLDMQTGRDAGWADSTPWPNGDGADATTVTNVTSQTQFQITRPAGTADLPTGITDPSMMVWNLGSSIYESLDVASVTPAGGDVFDVVLNTAPTMTIAIGVVVCPDTELRDIIAAAAVAYFDSLGPGEVIDLTSDARAHRAYRFPTPDEVYPQRAGASILTYLTDALGSSLADSTLEDMSETMPDVPVTPAPLGPEMLVLGNLGVYAL